MSWNLASQRTEPYGTPLTVDVSAARSLSIGSLLPVTIELETTAQCTALQWLEPAQTSNKKHPYMFSQCQAIHARSLFPCQDTPDVKSTVAFRIRSSLPVLASGLPRGIDNYQPGKAGSSGSLLYSFDQPVPIPSYLFAIASGDIASAQIGPRSQVFTGPEELTACQWEFEKDTERYIEIGEKLVYPYAWNSYNILVLPPSFPYGGMENPQYTFATPTIVSGDRQNTDVIAHELSHSWSGNLVACASWQDFWLNESWTTYLERRIQAEIHQDDRYRDFSAIIGWKALSDSIRNYGEDHEFTKLVPNLQGKDPDDAFSSIPYEKGFALLYQLEKSIGRDKWDPFIRHYFTVFKEKSIDSYEFKAALFDFFAKDEAATAHLNAIDWHERFYKPGFPPKPNFDTSLVDACLDLAQKWQALDHGSKDFTPAHSDIEHLAAQQIYVFLEAVQQFEKPVAPQTYVLMGGSYGFEGSKNVEIVSRYYMIGLRARSKDAYKPTADLVSKVGRMKFILPLYRELLECDGKLARSTFAANKDFYHPIARGLLEKILQKAEST